MKKTGIGIIGCGTISGIYMRTMAQFRHLARVACADKLAERAAAQAQQFNIPKAVSVEELLADDSVDIVVNLTVPLAHAEVSRKALAAGKHVYSEKPLAIDRQEGRALLELAAHKGLRIGCAPDTFLGAGLQTCRKLIDEGAIGEPVACHAFMLCHGHESWHPAPEFYYQRGGGPMRDMGPYYLTALIFLLGPVAAVSGSAHTTFAERIITSAPKAGTVIPVEVPTHLVGLLEFSSGIPGVLVTSFDVWTSTLPRIEIYGTEGTLLVPDPNTFGGPVKLWRRQTREWEEAPLSFPYETNSRGLGVAEMAAALASGVPHRASADLAFHVIDIMDAVEDAARARRQVRIESTCARPEPLPAGFLKALTS